MKTIKNEWKNIFNNKLLLVSFVVICFIPILYAAFFLRSVWDPYGKTENLPVAVVNEDKAVVLKGKQLNVGAELVEQLKKNKSLGWNFVDANEAQKGLESQKYYMVLTLGEDFSKNAATVLDNKPQQMEITYKTNGSLNYLGEVVGETAAKQLQGEVSNNVTNAYVTTMFDQIDTVGAGFNQAADGASKLNDGSSKILDGNTKLNSNLNALASSTILFKSGTSTFNNGITAYVNGVKKVDGGITQIDNGISKMLKSMPELTKGANDLDKGSKSLTSGLNQYTAGVNKLEDNTNVLVSKNAQLKTGINKLNEGFKSLPQLSKGSNDIYTGLVGLNDALPSNTGQVATKINTLNEEIQALSTNSGKAVTNTNINDSISNANTNLNLIKKNDSTFNSTTALNNITASSAFASLDSETKKELTSTIQAELTKYDTVDNSTNIANLQANLNTISNNSKQTVSSNDSSLQSSVNAIASEANTLLPTSSKIIGGVDNVKTTLDSKLVPGMSQVNNGVAVLNGSSSSVNELNNGVEQYLGATTLVNMGIRTINTNSDALNAGSANLSNGLASLNKKVPTLVKGSQTLNGGTKKIKSGTNALTSKSSQLLNGAATIDQTADKFVDGSSKLSQGSNTLQTALQILNGGTGELSTKLGDGAKKVNDIKVNDDNVKMIASPDKLVHEKYSDVPNYGHALAPYVLSLALYVGCLIFNFIIPIRKVSTKDASDFSWWASKVSIGLVAAIIMAIVEAGIMLLLGLEPVFLAKYFTMALVSALAYMFIIMFLAITFDNPGRFVAMVLLVLQLAASGGTFPMQLTSDFFNTIHNWLPMTHSINGFREAISSGLGSGVFVSSASILFLIALISSGLMYVSMTFLKKHHKDDKSQLDDNQKILDTNYTYNN